MMHPQGILGLALIALAGCVMPPQDEGAIAPPQAREERREAFALAPADLHAEDSAEAEQWPPVPRRRPEVMQVARLSKPQNDPGPGIAGLVGLDFDATKALLGMPALDEVLPPARVWAYNGSGCVLSIFFFPHLDGNTFRALTYEVKGAEDTPDQANRCFTELLGAGGGQVN